jgi:type III secretion protein L
MQRVSPLNRPTVMTLAGIESYRRVIPADRVAEIEQIAAHAVEPSRRIEQAESRCREGIGRIAHAGWQRGFSRGHAEALARLSDFLGALDERRKSVDAELAALVADAVSKIVRRLPPDMLTESLIAAALDEAQGERGRAVLRVHPERVAVAESALGRPAGSTSTALCVVVEADSALAPDDCILETPSGVIEVGLGIQLEALGVLLNTSQESS